jgi:hypothetical protein
MDKFKGNDTWKKDVLFNLASLGDVALFDYWLSKKKLNIDIQDEDGDTALHSMRQESIAKAMRVEEPTIGVR